MKLSCSILFMFSVLSQPALGQACEGGTQFRFNTMMCETFMCTKCTSQWCMEKCQAVQKIFPKCVCKDWPKARTSYSSGDFAGKGNFGDVGDYAPKSSFQTCFHPGEDVGGASNACGYMRVLTVISTDDHKPEFHRGATRTVDVGMLAGAGDCQHFCAANKKCSYFHFNDGHCYLKEDYSDAEKDENGGCNPSYEATKAGISGPAHCMVNFDVPKTCIYPGEDVGGAANNCGHMHVLKIVSTDGHKPGWYRGAAQTVDVGELPDANACQKLCADDELCSYFHFNDGHCYLKEAYSDEEGSCNPLYEPTKAGYSGPASCEADFAVKRCIHPGEDVGGASNNCGFMHVLKLVSTDGHKPAWYDGAMQTVGSDELPDANACLHFCADDDECSYFHFNDGHCYLKEDYSAEKKVTIGCNPLYEPTKAGFSGHARCMSTYTAKSPPKTCIQAGADVGGASNKCGYMPVLKIVSTDGYKPDFYQGATETVGNYELPDANACQHFCANDEKCSYFHFNDGHCYLKEDYSDALYAEKDQDGGCNPLYEPVKAGFSGPPRCD